MVSFGMREFLLCFSPSCLSLLFMSNPKNHCHVKKIPCNVFFYEFMVLDLLFKLSIHFKIMFWHGRRQRYGIIIFHVFVQFLKHHLLKRLSFVLSIFLDLLLKINLSYIHGFISMLSILLYWSMCLFLHQYHTIWLQ